MPNNPETEVSDLLSILMPPTRLRIWLDKVFAQKRAKGEIVPEDFTQWLAIVERICSDLPSEIDGIPGDQWAWVERKIFSRQQNLVQPELITVVSPSKVMAY